MKTYSKLNFASIIPDVVSSFADNKALGFVDGEYLTYSQMGDKIKAVMAFLESLGIDPGDKVVIFGQNMPNWGVVYLALQCMGVISIPVLPDFNKHELENVLLHSEAKTIFISKNLEYKLNDIKKDLIESVISMEDFSLLEGKSSARAEFNKDASPLKTYNPDEEALAILLYTSGTTGNSKGVMLSQKNVISNAIEAGGVQTILENDRFLSVLPLSHTYENTLGFILPILSGANVSYLTKAPTASVLLPALQKVRPDVMLTVPMIIEKVYRNSILPVIQKNAITRSLHKFRPTQKLLYRMAGKKLYKTFGGNLKFFGIGGAKLDAVVERFLRDARFPYAIGYGLTETSPLAAGSNASMTRFQAIGPKIKGCEVIINKPDPHSGEGEIWVKGPNVMLGYYKDKERTAEVMTPDGWFKTGDLGVFDRQGWLSHKGRLKNMIVGANGENIYPEEIESLINNFRHVVESIVIKKKGKLVAMVHFNREELEKKLVGMKSGIGSEIDKKLEGVTSRVEEYINDLASELQAYINTRVNKFSRIQVMLVQSEPFQKTATQKIKRYLYY